jgi:hypothetical protein
VFKKMERYLSHSATGEVKGLYGMCLTSPVATNS